MCSFETSVPTRTTRRHIPEDDILHSHRHENLRSYKETRLFPEPVWTVWWRVSAPAEDRNQPRDEGTYSNSNIRGLYFLVVRFESHLDTDSPALPLVYFTFNPEDWSNALLWNIITLLPDYTVLHLRSQRCENLNCNTPCYGSKEYWRTYCNVSSQNCPRFR
jgi:hypothetical protein